MKLLLVLCAVVACALAGFLPAQVGKGVAHAGADIGKFGTDAFRAANLLRDSRNNNAFYDEWVNKDQQSGRRGNAYGDEASRDAAKQQASRQKYGQNAATWDQNEDARERAAARDQHWAQRQNELAKKDAADRAAANNYWSEGNQFRKGRRNHDNIDYGFDKKFNTHNREDGGYEYNESSDSHALDDIANKKALYDKRRSDHAAHAAKADAQSADRKTAFAQKAAAAAASADKYGRDYDSAAHSNGRNKELAQKLDASQAGNRYWSDARDRAVDAYSDLAARDSNAARQSKKAGDLDGKLGSADYGYGLAGVKGYAPKPGAYPFGAGKGIAAADYAKRAGAADLAKLWDQSQENRLKKTAKDSTRDQAKSSFSKDQWLNDKVQGFDRDQAAKSNDHGYSDWANKGDKSASGYDAKSADAASKSAAQQGRWDLDENQWNEEARNRKLQDRKANRKVSKKFYNNKENGGDNWERLNYDRDQIDDVFGHNAGVKKDAANRHADSRYHQVYDANARKADAAHAADKQRAFNQNDWKKEADGYNAADAAWADKANAERRGLRNDAYKNFREQDNYDRGQRQADAWKRGVDGYGADHRAYGKNYGAVDSNVAAAAYPYVGAGAGIAVPAYGGQGYYGGVYGAKAAYPYANNGFYGAYH